MKYTFILSGDFIDLAKEEVLSLLEIKNCKIIDRLLIINLNKKMLNRKFLRLGLTKSVHKYLFECDINNLKDSMKNFSWSSIYKDNFCLRVHYLGAVKNNQVFSERNLAGYIWRSLQKPKVNLENSKTEIDLFFYKNKVYCGLSIYKNKEDFEQRKSHLRPFPHSSSLHPKLARALVNITGIKENEILLDSFCGTGGFLIEAGLMNIKCIGYDIYKILINGCKRNLDYFKIRNYRLRNKNALTINDKFDYFVTDLPYGLNSNVLMKYEKDLWKNHRINKKIQKKGFIKNLEKFYLEFLRNLREKLTKKAVIVFPSYVNYKKLLKQAQFKIEKEFSNYVHRSLTRKIVKIR